MGAGLKERVAVVSGAASGIGRAIAEALYDEGAAVAVLDISNAAEAAGEIGSDALGVDCDVRSASAVGSAIERAVGQFGRIDIVVNTAGVGDDDDMTAETTDANFDRIVSVNFRGTFHVTRAALPLLKERGGSIINIASIAALKGYKTASIYCATKGAMVSFTRAVAVEYAEFGVRANVICPGHIDTPMFRRPGVDVVAKTARAITTIPLGRIGVPGDLTGLAVLLASDAGSYITGAVIPVDGGVTAA
jgi:NAD(P)-dependent dehydrogenase (short-subunit alcohol dehydrogenase family)